MKKVIDDTEAMMIKEKVNDLEKILSTLIILDTALISNEIVPKQDIQHVVSLLSNDTEEVITKLCNTLKIERI